MCIHTLRYYHDGCAHQSVVPSSGPGFILPEKCTAVRNSLRFYHTQPSRAPEMWPPPCPKICKAVWGTEACKGNVRCAFRPGKCDECTREDQLVDLARNLAESVKGFTHHGSWATRPTGALMPHESSFKKQAAKVEIVRGLIEENPYSFTEDALRYLSGQLLGKNVVSRANKHNAPFWKLFKQCFAGQLSAVELANLNRFLRGPPLLTEGGDSSTALWVDTSMTSWPVPAAGQISGLKSGQEVRGNQVSPFSANPVESPVEATMSDPEMKMGSRLQSLAIRDSLIRRPASSPALKTSKHRPTRAIYLPPHKRVLKASPVFVSMDTSCAVPHFVGHAKPSIFKDAVEEFLTALDNELRVKAENSALKIANTVNTGLAEEDVRDDCCGTGFNFQGRRVRTW